VYGFYDDGLEIIKKIYKSRKLSMTVLNKYKKIIIINNDGFNSDPRCTWEDICMIIKGTHPRMELFKNVSRNLPTDTYKFNISRKHQRIMNIIQYCIFEDRV